MEWPGCYSLEPNGLSQSILNAIASCPNFLSLLFKTPNLGSKLSIFLKQTLEEGKPLPISHIDDNIFKIDKVSEVMDCIMDGFEYSHFFININNLDRITDFPFFIYKFTDPTKDTNVNPVLEHKDFIFHLNSFVVKTGDSPINNFTTYTLAKNNKLKCFKNNSVEYLENVSIDTFSKDIIFLLYTCVLDISLPIQNKEQKDKKIIHKITFNGANELKIEEFIHEGEKYDLHDLKLKIDKLEKDNNRKFKIISNFPRFRRYCKNKTCEGKIIGNQSGDKIVITKVCNHSEDCQETGYYPSKERKLEDIHSIHIHKVVKQSYNELVLNDYFPYPYSTLCKMVARKEGKSPEEHSKDWYLIDSFVHSFANADGSNILYETIEKDNGRIEVQQFFIIPVECINFMNSKLFIGLVVIDGTFLKFYKIGTLLILATYTGTHDILVLGFGYCPRESSTHIGPFLNLLKKNVNEKVIQAFMSDEGGAILKSIKEIFPNAIRRNCLIHKKSHLNKDERNLLTMTYYAPTTIEFQSILSNYFIKRNYPLKDKKKLKETMQRYSPLYRTAPTQGVSTNGACETVNSILKCNNSDSIIDYMRTLYFKIRNTLFNMPSKCNDEHTKWLDNQIEQYAYKSSKHDIVSINQQGNIVTVSDKIRGKVHKFTVSIEQDQITCSCKQSEEMLFGCYHIFYVLKNTDRNFEETIHDCYKTENIKEFVSSLPEPVDLDNLQLNKRIIAPEKNRRKGNGKRHKCQIDYVFKKAKKQIPKSVL